MYVTDIWVIITYVVIAIGLHKISAKFKRNLKETNSVWHVILIYILYHKIFLYYYENVDLLILIAFLIMLVTWSNAFTLGQDFI